MQNAMRALLLASQLCLCWAVMRRSAHQRSALETLRSLLQDCEGIDCMLRYVNEPDAAYAWTDTGVVLEGNDLSNGVGYKAYVLNMTSQHWLTPQDTSASLWWHPLVVAVPANLEASNWTTLVVGGAGARNQDFTTPAAPWLENADVVAAIAFATRTKTLAAALLMAPNQWMTLPDFDASERLEDGIKAYTWVEYMNHTDHPEWPIEMPNVKAVVRAMDTVTAFTETLQLPGGASARFAVTGCSKRGMASWDAAAVDPRVKAIMPTVIGWDIRNSTYFGLSALGGASALMHDYVDSGIWPMLEGPEADRLLAIIDPVNFKERFEGIPKLLLDAANDEIFGPDSVAMYWDQVPEPKSFLSLPNLGHQGSLSLNNFLPAAAAWLRGIVTEASMPQIEWTVDRESGTITARQVSAHTPLAVQQFTAVSCGSERRDFRLMTADAVEACGKCGHVDPIMRMGMRRQTGFAPPSLCMVDSAAHYAPTALAETAPGSGTWQGSVAAPSDGRWAATYLMFTYPPLEAGAASLSLSTEVMIFPDTVPFPACREQLCLSRMQVV